VDYKVTTAVAWLEMQNIKLKLERQSNQHGQPLSQNRTAGKGQAEHRVTIEASIHIGDRCSAEFIPKPNETAAMIMKMLGKKHCVSRQWMIVLA